MKKDFEFAEYLKENGIKPSIQRLSIYKFLYNNRNHPSVDVIYRNLLQDIPTLSKTTVYNTLKIFVEKQIISEIKIEDKEAVFDADETLHGHFKCKKCGRIYDFAVEIGEEAYKELKDFAIQEKNIYLKGVCKNCKE